MELDDRFGCCDALVGDYVLAGVVTFLWAGPEEKTVKQSWMGQLGSNLEERNIRMAVVLPYAQFSCLQTWSCERCLKGVWNVYLNTFLEFRKTVAI